MGEENRRLLEEEIKSKMEYLNTLNPESQEYTTVLINLSKLYNLKLEEDKIVYDCVDKIRKCENEKNFKQAQQRDAVIDRYVRIAIAGIELLVPLIFYNVWMNKGFKFEEKGYINSYTFRNLFSRIKPTKK